MLPAISAGWHMVRATSRRCGDVVTGQQRLAAPGDAARHADGRTHHRAPVVDRLADDVHVEQLGELAVELPARLVLAVVGVVGAAVRAQELGPVDDLVHGGRHVVLGHAAAQEAQAVVGGEVLVEQLAHGALQLGLRVDRPRHLAARP